MGTYGGKRQWGALIVVVLLGLPSIGLLVSGVQLHPLVAAAVYGAGILAGAFLFSWAAEVAELDISASLAIAILALLTVLPEYAIEAVLAWDAGASFDPATRAVTDETERVAANVNGANRMLVGVGWPVVILVSWAVHRRVLDLRGHIGPEMTFLTIATAVTFPLFFIMQIHFLIAAALIALYVAYLWVSSRREGGDTELAGISRRRGSPARRLASRHGDPAVPLRRRSHRAWRPTHSWVAWWKPDCSWASTNSS